MSTYRYSGQIRIRITYQEPSCLAGPNQRLNGSYRCFLRSENDTAIVIIGVPAFLSHGVDSPEAFDEAASAAIAFACHDAEKDCLAGKYYIDWGYATTPDNYHIGRSKKDAWSKE